MQRDVSRENEAGRSAPVPFDRTYERIVESVTTYGVIGIALDGTITHWNRGAEQVFGHRREEIVSALIDELFTADDRAKGVPARELAAVRKDGKAEDNRWYQRKDGTAFWANAVVTPQRDEDGKLLAFVKVVRDDTRSRLAEEELRRRAKELSRSNSELQEFAFVASHDLKEPLRTVSSYVQLLERRYEKNLDQEGRGYIHIATQSVKQMYALINDILEFARIGTAREAIAPVDCNAIFERCVKNLELALGEVGAKVHNHGLPTISGVESLLTQLFQNLIGNAVKFRSAAPPEVHVSSELIPEGWLFSVSDNGIGINPEYSDKIFRLFQRLHSKESYPGSGIGLTVCKKIIEQHGGRIWFESEPGCGTTFYFTLPA